jgi:hypothetical protein
MSMIACESVSDLLDAGAGAALPSGSRDHLLKPVLQSSRGRSEAAFALIEAKSFERLGAP